MAGRFNLAAGISVLLLSTGALMAQSVISAKSGLIHYVEGDVTVDDQAVEMKNSQFPDMKAGQVLKTEDGRAEVLLTPGVFLRVAENSSFRLVSNGLSDTKVEALTGSLMIEHGELNKDTSVTLLYKDRSITFDKSGLYRLDTDTGKFRVYQGEARVVAGGQTTTAKQAHELELNEATLIATKFDNKVGDEFYRWASRRASYLALANISAAKAVRDSGMHYTSGSWYWNPWFGMFTYVPFGNYYSPFGYSFWSPTRVISLYQPRVWAPVHGGGSYAGGSGMGHGVRYDAATGYSIPSRSAASMGSSSMGSSSMGSISNASSGMGSNSSGHSSAAGSVSGGASSGGGMGGGMRGGEGASGGRGR
jgi:hypothetical protein